MNYRKVAIQCSVFLALAILGTDAWALTETIDRRTMSERYDYWVYFASRDNSSTGHAMVIMFTDDPTIANQSPHKAVGFYPKNNKFLAIALYPLRVAEGELKYDEIHGFMRYANNVLKVRMSRDMFKKIDRKINSWSGPYVLIIRDCVSFVDTLAYTANLNRKRSWLSYTPDKYIKYLITKNKQ